MTLENCTKEELLQILVRLSESARAAASIERALDEIENARKKNVR